VPTRLEIHGVNLRRQISSGGAFGVDLCDAIMRLYKRLDDRMYNAGQTRWRHFLPASFTVTKLMHQLLFLPTGFCIKQFLYLIHLFWVLG
jgi:hypothetical protein